MLRFLSSCIANKHLKHIPESFLKNKTKLGRRHETIKHNHLSLKLLTRPQHQLLQVDPRLITRKPLLVPRSDTSGSYGRLIRSPLKILIIYSFSLSCSCFRPSLQFRRMCYMKIIYEILKVSSDLTCETGCELNQNRHLSPTVNLTLSTTCSPGSSVRVMNVAHLETWETTQTFSLHGSCLNQLTPALSWWHLCITWELAQKKYLTNPFNVFLKIEL